MTNLPPKLQIEVRSILIRRIDGYSFAIYLSTGSLQKEFPPAPGRRWKTFPTARIATDALKEMRSAVLDACRGGLPGVNHEKFSEPVGV